MEEKGAKEFCKGAALLALMMYQVLQQTDGLSTGTTECLSVGFAILTLVIGYEWNYVQEQRDYWTGMRRIYLNYWILYVVFSYLVLTWKNHLYEGRVKNILLDVLGVSGLFGTPSICSTGWYMSVIVVGWCISPLLRRLVRYANLSLLAGGVMGVILLGDFAQNPGIGRIGYYLLILMTGMCCSEMQIDIWVRQWMNGKKWELPAWFAVLVGLSLYLRVKLGITMELLLAGSLLLLLYCIWKHIPQMNEGFFYLGENSFLLLLITGFMMECGYGEQLQDRYDSVIVMAGALLAGALTVLILEAKWKEKIR